jgi:sphingomyelin phosphodiesterase 2
MQAIRSTNPDIVALQEVYESKHSDAITAGLKDILPYHARHSSGGIIRFHNGLSIYSRYPITSSALHTHAKQSMAEKLMATKSFLEATIQVTDTKSYMFLNCHTTAGGGKF